MGGYRGCNSKDISQHFRLMLLISLTNMDIVSVKGEVEGGRNWNHHLKDSRAHQHLPSPAGVWGSCVMLLIESIYIDKVSRRFRRENLKLSMKRIDYITSFDSFVRILILINLDNVLLVLCYSTFSSTSKLSGLLQIAWGFEVAYVICLFTNLTI